MFDYLLRGFWQRVARSIASQVTAEIPKVFSRPAEEPVTPTTAYLLQAFEAHQREMRSLIRHLSLPAKELWWQGVQAMPETLPPFGVFDQSTICRQEHLDRPVYTYWLNRIGLGPEYHRKNWEHVFISQALFERKMLAPGRRGLGFAVGQEPLAALFASMGCQIVATDLPADSSRATDWSKSCEHAANKANIARQSLLAMEEFDRLVDFRPVDMNDIPPDLTDFDFCWSACAFEHLGSIEAGMRFVERSIGCLKPGGIAVHTTEFNLSSNTDTVDNQDTVLYRRRDMEELADRLRSRGFKVAQLDFDPGSLPMDRYVDLPPYCNNPHLRLALMGYVATSFGLIVQR